MIGASFQPGASGRTPAYASQPRSTAPVQEAIQILSLRLPKVVGAQGVAPQALLSSPGGGGAGSRVDSVVNQVLSRMFPTTGVPASPAQTASFGMAPSASNGPEPSFPSAPASSYAPPPTAPTFTGGHTGYRPTPQLDSWSPPPNFNPRVIIGPAFQPGDLTIGPDGRPFGGGVVGGLPEWNGGSPPPASIAPLPQWPSPSWSAPSEPDWSTPLF